MLKNHDKTFVQMMEQLGYDVQLIYVEREQKRGV